MVSITDGADVASDRYWSTLAARNALTNANLEAARVRGNPASPQTQVDAARNELNAAIAVFRAERRLGTRPLDAGSLGLSAHLSGRVYEYDWDDRDTIPFTPFPAGRTATVYSYPPGAATGRITNRMLNVTLGIPAPGYLWNMAEALRDMDMGDEGDLYMLEWLEFFDDLEVSNPAARAAFLSLRTLGGNLERRHSLETQTVFRHEFVGFIFVNAAVTISGTGTTDTVMEGGTLFTFTSDDFSISLLPGWNALHVVMTGSVTPGGMFGTVSVHHANPIGQPHWMVPADGRTALSAAIAAAETLRAATSESQDSTDVEPGAYWATHDTHTAFASAISAARAVYNNRYSGRTQIDMARETLVAAHSAFTAARSQRADTTALSAAIAAAEALRAETRESQDGTALEPATYWATPDTHTAFFDAINEAASVRDNPVSTQAEVDTAHGALVAARNVFTAARNQRADTTALSAAIAAAETLLADTVVSQDGTDVSFDAFRAYWATSTAHTAFSGAISEAASVRDNPASTQA